jgi:hypothetical protein
MAIVALIAVEVAALRLADDNSVDACRLLTAATLVVATFLARNRVGGEGAFWFGFALLGWATFILVLDARASSYQVVDALTGRRSVSSVSLVSRLPLQILMARFDGGSSISSSTVHRVMGQFQILHFMLILASGFVGGYVGWLMGRWRGRLPRDAGGVALADHKC